MTVKVCTKCFVSKSLSEFSFQNKRKGTLSSQCKLCTRAYNKAHYEKDIERSRSCRRISRKQSQKVKRAKYFEYLSSHPCVDCGETDPIVLEFDHVRHLWCEPLTGM